MGFDLKLDDVRFDFEADCQKAWQDDKGKMFVRAVASDDRLDLQRDRMSPTALKKMADAAKTGVPFLETHRGVFEFGKTVGGEVVEREEGGKRFRQFVVDVELDGDFPQARKLFKEVAAGKCARQLSIGGKLNLKNRDAVTVEMTASGMSRTINDLDLDHIASTREKQAANPRTSFMEAVSKALDEAESAGWETPRIEKGTTMNQKSEMVADAVNLNADVEAGVGFLASLGRRFGKMFGGGKQMKKANEATPTEEETTTPESDEATPASTPEGMEAKTVGKKKPEEMTAQDLLNDISVLLAKKGPPPWIKDEDSEDSEDSDASEDTVTEKAYHALWAVRYALAKDGGEATMADQGPFAPRSGAHGPGANDKASGETDVASSAVTDHRKNIQIGGEQTSTAPTAKEALDMTMAAVASVGKDLKSGESLEKVLTTVLEKTQANSTEIAKTMVTVAVEKVLEEQVKGLATIQKSVDGMSTVMNDTNRRLAEMESRMTRVEKAGGVRQGGPRGSEDAEVTKSGGKKSTWGGIFNKPVSEALSKY